MFLIEYYLGEFPGGGGGHFIIDVTGTCRWTGYDFPVITIDTGYLNRPICYWRATPFITGLLPSPQCLWQARDLGTSDATPVRAGRNRFLWMYDDTQRYIPGAQYCNRVCIWFFFSKVYCDRVYFFCAELFETGSGFHPPPVQLSGECPPPSSWEMSAPGGRIMWGSDGLLGALIMYRNKM